MIWYISNMIWYISNMVWYIYQVVFDFLVITLPSSLNYIWTSWISEIFTVNPISLGIFLQIIVILLLILVYKLAKNWKFWLLFEYIVESVHNFFEEILEESGKKRIKVYVVTLFFVILLSNLSSWILDRIRMIFVDVDRLTTMIIIPTTSFEFNIWLAVVSIVLVLVAQFSKWWIGPWLIEYFPILWKKIITIDRWNMKSFIYYPAVVIVKIFDIVISLFVGLLDVVWIFAKIISLSARLYGNMMAWWILLTLVFVATTGLTEKLLWFNFPFALPLVLYAQWLLVALIQAFVFPLLVWIFMKLAQEGTD